MGPLAPDHGCLHGAESRAGRVLPSLMHGKGVAGCTPGSVKEAKEITAPSAPACSVPHACPRRALLAPQAEQRQKDFERSAVGRAAIKSVKESKKVEQRQVNTTAQDWMS